MRACVRAMGWLDGGWRSWRDREVALYWVTGLGEWEVERTGDSAVVGSMSQASTEATHEKAGPIVQFLTRRLSFSR